MTKNIIREILTTILGIGFVISVGYFFYIELLSTPWFFLAVVIGSFLIAGKDEILFNIVSTNAGKAIGLWLNKKTNYEGSLYQPPSDKEA